MQQLTMHGTYAVLFVSQWRRLSQWLRLRWVPRQGFRLKSPQALLTRLEQPLSSIRYRNPDRNPVFDFIPAPSSLRGHSSCHGHDDFAAGLDD